MRLFRFVPLLACFVLSGPTTDALHAADKNKHHDDDDDDDDDDRPPRGDVTTFGPVALGSKHGLRFCHANHFGDKSIAIEWVFVAVLPYDFSTPPVGELTKVVGRIAFALPPQTGNCAQIAPDLVQLPEGSSILAVLIGQLKDGRTTTEVVASAQVVELGSTGGGGPIGPLLPAVQKRGVELPQVIP